MNVWQKTLGGGWFNMKYAEYAYIDTTLKGICTVCVQNSSGESVELMTTPDHDKAEAYLDAIMRNLNEAEWYK